MFETHDPIAIKGFRGLYLRGEGETCPADRLLECQNFIFRPGTIRTRESLTRSVAPVAAYLDRKFFTYSNGTTGMLYSTVGNKLYVEGQVLPLVDTSATILWSKFQIVQPDKSNVVYILFESDSAGNRLYIWKPGTTTARPAGAVAPLGIGAMPVANGAAGPIVPEAGWYVFGVVYETDTGFYTKIGPTPDDGVTLHLSVFQASGAHAITITGIPTGPAGTVYRHIVVSRVASAYNGNPKAHELFFISDNKGRIPDNVTTTKTFTDLFSQDLVRSADYLFDRISAPPAGTGLTLIGKRLIIFGEISDKRNILVSNLSDYEGFDNIDGKIVTPNIDRVIGIEELRGTIYVFKSSSTFAYQDEGEFPAEWPFVLVDDARSPSRLVKLKENSSGIDDRILVIADGRLTEFNGTYGEELSYSIPSLLKEADSTKIFYVNPRHRYILIGLTTSAKFIFGDFSEGLSAETIKWSTLDYANVSVNAGILLGTYAPVDPTGYVEFVYPAMIFRTTIVESSLGFDNGKLLIDPDIAIPQVIKFPYIGTDDRINHYLGITVNAKHGFGSLGSYSVLQIKAYGKDDVKFITPRSLSISSGKTFTRLFNFVNEKCSIRLEMNAVGDNIELREITLHQKILWLMGVSV